MNRYQLNAIEMATTVAAYMAKEENSAIWQSNVPITETLAEVDGDLEAIAALATKQDKPIVGPAADKAEARFDFENQIVMVSGQIAALAAKNKDATLEEQADLTMAELGKMAADALEATGTRISGLATANLAALAPYGITQADITLLDQLQATFSAFKSKPREAVVERKKETDLIPPLVSNLLSTLRRQLDRQMLRFKTSHPEFYQGYLAARVIVDRGEPPEKETPPAPPATPA